MKGSTMEYSVKGVKTFRGMEGTGWECSLYKDGKKIGTVLDDAHGGPLMFYIPQNEHKILDDHCKTLPKQPWGFEAEGLDPEGCSVDADIFIGNIVADFIENRDFKRRCKTHTIFTLKDEPKEFWSMKALFTPAVEAHLVKKYGANMKEIINKRFI